MTYGVQGCHEVVWVGPELRAGSAVETESIHFAVALTDSTAPTPAPAPAPAPEH